MYSIGTLHTETPNTILPLSLSLCDGQRCRLRKFCLFERMVLLPACRNSSKSATSSGSPLPEPDERTTSMPVRLSSTVQLLSSCTTPPCEMNTPLAWQHQSREVFGQQFFMCLMMQRRISNVILMVVLATVHTHD